MEAMILTVSELLSQLPARGALVGLDVGTKRIGVATSDPDRRLDARSAGDGQSIRSEP